jgi:hypothetical protein
LGSVREPGAEWECLGLAPAWASGLRSISVAFVTQDLHSRGVSAYLASLAPGTSLVDLVSFEYMRDEHLTTAFAFDRDFSGQGFVLVP